MALAMKNSRPVQSKIITTVFAIAALLLQPVVALNVPSAFASGEMKIYASSYYSSANNFDGQCVRATATPRCQTIQQAIDIANPEDTIKLIGNFDVSEQITVDKKVTIDGNGGSNNYKAVIYANFDTTDNGNNAVFGLRAPATIQNLTVNAKGHSIHGINAWHTNGQASLLDVTVENARKAGLNVGEQANVKADSITTTGSGWYGINVDKNNALLTVTGASAHNEGALAHIFIDDRNSNVTVNDVNSQYVRFWAGNGYAYMLDTEKPTVATTINSIYNPTELKIVAHDDQRLSRIDVSVRKDNDVPVKWFGQDISYENKNDFTVDYSEQFAALNLPDGEYTVRATVSDILKKTTNATNINFTVDSSGPTASLTASNTDPTTKDSVVITGSVAESDIESHSFEITTPSGSYNEYNMNTTDLSYSFTLNTADGAGKYVIRYVATDKAQNRSDANGSSILEINVKKVPQTNTETVVTTPGETTPEPKPKSVSTPPATIFPNGLLFNNFATTGPSASGDILAAESNKQEEARQNVLKNADNLAAVAGDQTKAGFWEQLLNWWWVPAAILAVSILLWLIAAARRNKEEI